MATSLSILISDTSGCVIFRRLSIAPVSGQPWEDFQLNHLVLAFLVAARFADPIVSLQPYQFARDTITCRNRVNMSRMRRIVSDLKLQEFTALAEFATRMPSG